MDSFVAGAIAGISEVLTMYPLDVVKTRSQLYVGKSMGTIATLSNIVKQEGFSRLYRGIIPPICMEAPKRATNLRQMICGTNSIENYSTSRRPLKV